MEIVHNCFRIMSLDGSGRRNSRTAIILIIILHFTLAVTYSAECYKCPSEELLTDYELMHILCEENEARQQNIYLSEMQVHILKNISQAFQLCSENQNSMKCEASSCYSALAQDTNDLMEVPMAYFVRGCGECSTLLALSNRIEDGHQTNEEDTVVVTSTGDAVSCVPCDQNLCNKIDRQQLLDQLQTTRNKLESVTGRAPNVGFSVRGHASTILYTSMMALSLICWYYIILFFKYVQIVF